MTSMTLVLCNAWKNTQGDWNAASRRSELMPDSSR